MKITSLFFMSIIALALTAQDLEKDYTPIVFKGKIPQHFIQDVKSISSAELKENENNDLSKKENQKYYVSSNEQLYYLLRSGNVYFNDEISNYVNDVASIILKNEADSIVKNLTFNVTKFPIPNAFCWRNGYVFVNIELFNFIETEAQLAFILSHEIEHYKKEHSINFYKKEISLKKRKRKQQKKEGIKIEGVFKDNKEVFKELEKMAFSKEQEFEADSAGFKLFKKTGYNQREAINSLAGLEKIGIEDSVIIPVNLAKHFSNELYKIDSSKLWKKGTISTIKPEVQEELKEEDELFSSHPELKKRRKVLEGLLDSEEGNSFIVSEARFQRIKEIIDFEKINFFYNNSYYLNAIYGSLVLLEKYPNNKYLQVKIGESLYKLLRIQHNGIQDAKLVKPEKVYNNIAYIEHYLSSINKKSFEKLVNGYVNNLHLMYELDKEIELLYAKCLLENKKKPQAKRIFKSFNLKDSPNYNYAKKKETIR